MSDPKTLTGSSAALTLLSNEVQRNEGKEVNKDVKILCFGDSLTEGYHNYGTAFSPYSETMQMAMNGELNGLRGGGWSVEVDTAGLSGESVNTMGRRMKRVYTRLEPETKPFSHVIFLGGTNDLGRSRDAPEIFSDIKQILAVPLATGATIVVMTVPECHVKIGWLDDRRNELNSSLKAWASENPNVHIFDLFEKIKYHSIGEKDRNDFWDDGLHLTAAGYEFMGELVARRMLEVLGVTKMEAEEEFGGV